MAMETEHRFCIIIGAGMCGVIVGAHIVKQKIFPYDDFRILDKQDDYGGVWQKNDYPGAACDVMSHCYSMRFHLNPSNWS
jgi:cation diffusion facilitator CzcD-associated flavoprotein CzcO